MKELAEIQQRMQDAILQNDPAILDDICDTSMENRTTLLNVYKHAYGARLTEFLENEFPVLSAWLGEERFNTLAMDYAGAHPSSHPNARWFGQKFASFVKASNDLSGNPECGELAALEHALNEAFDQTDQPTLSMHDLADLEPDEWSELTFTAHPSTSRLQHKTNAAKIWTAIHNEETPPEAKCLGEVHELIIWRGEDMARFRVMASDEAMIWDEAAKGANFATLCMLLGTYWPAEEAPMKAAGYLQTWLANEFLAKN